MQTASFKNFLKEKTIELINPKLNGELSIGHIEGNFFSKIQLNDVVIRDNDSTIFAINSLAINYKIKSIRDRHLCIDTLVINTPYFNLWYKDSTFLNVSHLFAKLQAKENNKETVFPLKLSVSNIFISNGKGSYQMKYGQLPIKVNEVELQANGVFANKHVEVGLQKIKVETGNPTLEIIDGKLHFLKKGRQMLLDSALLKTSHTLLEANASYESVDSFDVKLKIKSSSNRDIRTLLPDLPVRNIKNIDVSVSSMNGKVTANAQLANGSKRLDLAVLVNDSLNTLLKQEGNSKYSAKLAFKSFRPEEWFELSKTDVLLNGDLNVSGNNLLDYKKDIRLQGRFQNSYYKGTVADTFRVDAVQKNNEIDADILIVYNQSNSEGHLHVRDLYNVPVYTADFKTFNLDIEAIEPRVANTVVNGRIQLTGKYFKSSNREMKLEADLINSKVLDFEVDSMNLSSALRGVDFVADAASVYLPNNYIEFEGRYNLSDRSFESNVHLQSSHLKFLERYGVPDLDFEEAIFKGTVKGDEKFFEYSANMNLNGFSTGGLLVNVTNGSFDGEFNNGSILTNGVIGMQSVSNNFMPLDTLSASFAFKSDSLLASITFDNEDSVTGHLDAVIEVGDTLSFSFNEAELTLPFAQFYLTDTIQQFQLFNKTLLVNNIEINDRWDDAFDFKANGQLSSYLKENFELHIDRLNLFMFNRMIDEVDSIGGSFSTSIKMSGEPDSISIKGEYTLADPSYNRFELPSVEGQINYDTDTLLFNTWVPSLDSSLFAHLALPLKINLKSKDAMSVSASDSFNMQLVIDSLSIKKPEMGAYQYLEAGAYLDGIIKANGSIHAPMLNGNLYMRDGFLTNQKMGIYYSDIASHLTFNNDVINVDTLVVNSDKGYFASKGYLAFDSTIVSGKLKSSNLTTDINNFHVIQQKNVDINLSGNPYYKSDENDNPLFGGKVLVNRSSFYLQNLIESDRSKSKDNIPLLVQAIQVEDTSMLNVEEVEVEAVSPLVKQLKGRLTFDIRRGTWLKSDDMNIEISGDFDIAKSGDYFELFGDVEVVRGHYILYGRKFNIEEGLITFSGGEKPDPRLDIAAEYTFRGSDREKHILRLSVTEFLSEPIIEFTLDDAAISESDAVSIMVFGKTMDELSYDGQNGIIGSVGSNMLASAITSSLNSTIGQRFNLDMIEVNSTENWTSAAFVVGKYITNDLFVIYQRGFGETEDDEITPETITLEYELNKLLFFRLQGGSSKTSGFDVILKFESSK